MAELTDLLETLSAPPIRTTEELDAYLERCVAHLSERFAHYDWVGIYRLDGDTLVLGPYRGQPTEHVRIPLGQGICGAAAASGRTEVVDDVRADPRYLACFPSTRSEIVVPIIWRGEVLGEIDVDSDRPAAFGEEDRRLLEALAGEIARAWGTLNPPTG